jgi:hypothetical protein
MQFQEPELVNGIMQAIQRISDEARRALADPELPRESLISALSVSSCLASNLCAVIHVPDACCRLSFMKIMDIS